MFRGITKQMKDMLSYSAAQKRKDTECREILRCKNTVLLEVNLQPALCRHKLI